MAAPEFSKQPPSILDEALARASDDDERVQVWQAYAEGSAEQHSTEFERVRRGFARRNHAGSYKYH